MSIRVRYAFIKDHRDEFRVTAICRMLRVHRSGFYAWCNRPISARSYDNERLVDLMRNAYDESSGSYGSPRICKDLREAGERYSENRVARLMREHSIRGHRRYRKLYSHSTRPSLLTPNRLEQQFLAQEPDVVWVTDITYIATSEGWLYLAVVIDLYSRLVVGWSMNSEMTTDLVLQALLCTLWRRKPKHKVLIHSDQGSQFNSDTWLRFCRDHNIERSMSRRGNCYDNAVAESFFSSLKKERIRNKVYLSRGQARADIFDYIEVFYNRKRRHSTLGMMSPDDFEQARVDH